MKKAGIVPRLRLAAKDEKGVPRSTGPHTVKMLEDKLINGKNKETGEPAYFVRYYLEENGEKKMYDVPVKDAKTGADHYLWQRLSEVKEGEVIVMECKKRGPKNYIEVRSMEAKGEEVAEVESHEEEEIQIGSEDEVAE